MAAVFSIRGEGLTERGADIENKEQELVPGSKPTALIDNNE